MRNLFVTILLVILALGFSAYAAYPQLKLTVADIHSPAFHVKNINIQFVDHQASEFTINIEELGVQDHVWRNLNLSCGQFKVNERHIHCVSGQINLADSLSLPMVFQLNHAERKLMFEIKPTAKESWQVLMDWDEDNWQVRVNIVEGRVAHIKHWLPDGGTVPELTNGEIDLAAALSGDTDGLAHFVLDASLDEVSFSDPVGLHAGENVQLNIKAKADFIAEKNEWLWQTDVTWPRGEVFWQPVYLVGDGDRLSLNGIFGDERIRLRNGKLILSEIGEFEFSGLMTRSGHELHDFELHADNLELAVLFERILKPFFQDTAFAELEVSGQSNLVWQFRNGVSEHLMLDLDDVSVIDQRGRFAFNRVDAHIPWRANKVTIADISILSGHALNIPFGSVRVPLEIRGFNLLLPQLVLPVLDSELRLENFVASYQQDRWFWSFNGELKSIPMARLTEALQVQEMHGTLSGHIPEISYDGREKVVSVKGELLFNVFDGDVVVNNLSLLEPMGFAPHLNADVEMRNLDLGLLTKTFSFGKMEGRVDMDMLDLELSNWRPIGFDAHLKSSPGNYRRRISQAAIENISSLGGESATAAIQRSFLRFFETFSYSEVGWRCVLLNNVCLMGGIEHDSGSDSYTLISGGGIPAITVMGYNQKVGWEALIDRLKRVTQESEPIIQ